MVVDVDIVGSSFATLVDLVFVFPSPRSWSRLISHRLEAVDYPVAGLWRYFKACRISALRLEAAVNSIINTYMYIIDTLYQSFIN